jgi:hypothetical protein
LSVQVRQFEDEHKKHIKLVKLYSALCHSHIFTEGVSSS